MPAAVEIYNDIVNNTLVQGLNSTSLFAFPNWFQGGKISIRYYPVVPILGAVSAPYFSKVGLSNLTLEMAIGPRAGAESLKAFQDTWTKQTSADSEGKSGYMYADLDLNTTDLNTAIGSESEYSTFIEFRLGESGVKRVTYQKAIQIIAVVLGPSGAASLPAGAAEYFTKAEMKELFVQWDNRNIQSAGKLITLASQDLGSARSLGVDNDKSAIDYVI